jgi:hypothetical protein
VNVTLLAGRDTHQRPVLQHLATDCTGTDEELTVVGDLLLEGATENGDLTVVACGRGGRGAVFGGRLDSREGFEGVVVEVLEEGRELARASLEYLLRNKTTDDGVNGSEVTSCLEGKLLEDLLVEVALELRLSGEVFRDGDEESGIGGVTSSGDAGVSLLEDGEGLETDVKGSGAVELGEVGNEELGGGDGFAKGFL